MTQDVTEPQHQNPHKTMRDTTFWEYHFGLNPGSLADYFKELIQKYPKVNRPGGEINGNWCRQNVISYLVGSSFWRENNIAKMLAWAKDKKTANDAQITYKEKYIGEFYREDVADLEKTENEFIEDEIIPVLKKEMKH